MARSSWIRPLGAVLAIGALGAAGAFVLPASAATSGTDPCGKPATFVQPLTSFGDSDVYVPVPGGSFEPGSPSWALTGGAVVGAGNETWKVGGSTNAYSLGLPAGSTATSPLLCIGVFYPTIRLFSLNSGDASSALRIDLVYKSPSGIQKVLTVGRLTGKAGWQLSPVLAFNAALLGSSGNGVLVSVKLTVEGNGAWRVDDAFVDPTKHR